MIILYYIMAYYTISYYLNHIQASCAAALAQAQLQEARRAPSEADAR